MLKSVSCIFFCLSTFLVLGQSYDFAKWNVEDGLSNQVIRNIEEDSKGFIWIATENGLNRFDGSEFITFKHIPGNANSLSHNALFGLAIDAQDRVWIGTDFGLNMYDPAIDSFKHFYHDPLRDNSISDNYIRAITIDEDENVWVGTQNGLNIVKSGTHEVMRLMDRRKIDDPNKSKKYSYNRINSILMAKNKEVWVGSDGGGIKIYTHLDETFEAISLTVPESQYWSKNIIRTIYQENAHIFWIGTDQGLAQYNRHTNEFSFFESDEKSGSLSSEYVWDILGVGDGLLWVSTYRGGINVFDTKAGKVVDYLNHDESKSASLSSDMIWTMTEDKSGGIWIGTDGAGGLNYYHDNLRKFDHYLSSEDVGFKLEVLSITELLKGQVLVTTREGIFSNNITDKNHHVHWVTISDSPASRVMRRDDELFIAGEGQLVITNLNLDTLRVYELKGLLPRTEITALAVSKSNQVAIGTIDFGLILVDRQSGEQKSFFSRGNSNLYQDSRFISSLLYDNSDLWVGSVRSGLFKINQTGMIKQFFYHDSVFFEPTISSMVKAGDHHLYLGTNSEGLIYFHTISEDYEIMSDDNNIFTSEITSMQLDSYDKLWIGSKSGLGYCNMEDHSFRSFDLSDGFQNKVFTSSSSQGVSGKLYFGGISGFNAFFPERIKPNLICGAPILKEVKVLGETVSNYSSLAHDEDRVEFLFSLPNYIHPEENQLSYRVNNNGDYIFLGNENKLSFAQLAPGNYTIEVRGHNNDGMTGSILDIRFKINQPWWKTWWFLALLSLMVIFLVWFWFWYRTKRIRETSKKLEKQVSTRTSELNAEKEKALKAKELISKQKDIIQTSLEERETLLREIHHRVKNNLQIIANLLYLQSGKTEDAQMKDILEQGQGRVRSMSLIHQKLYENDDLKNVAFGEYVTELVAAIRNSFGGKIGEVKINIRCDEIYFDVDHAIPLGLIINELATNSFKYAFNKISDGEFTIQLYKKENSYHLLVSDNGPGIPQNIDIHKGKSLGLRLIRILSQQLEGSFYIENRAGFNFELIFSRLDVH